MVSFILSLRRPEEARFESEAVYQVELSPHHHPRRRLARLLHFEAAILVAEILVVFRVQPIRHGDIIIAYCGKTRSLSLSWILF